ncbi:NADPH-dependent FMN reductase [Streptomyces sp. 4F]|nr:NADPH-dependent FMN reductase [Streptomyces sp. 4F]
MTKEPPVSDLKIAVILGSTRPGRNGKAVADWVMDRAGARTAAEYELVDLADHPLPLLDEPVPAARRQYRNEHTKAWAATIAAYDGYVFVTPEYNHGYPASLKLAIDYVYSEWRAKPVGFVSYGGMAGGQRAVEQLRQVFAELHAVTLRDTVSFHMAWEQFDDNGRPLDEGGCAKAAAVLLDQLDWWGRTLRDGRAARPYEG